MTRRGRAQPERWPRSPSLRGWRCKPEISRICASLLKVSHDFEQPVGDRL